MLFRSADINGDGYRDRIQRWIGNRGESGFINVYFYNNTDKVYSSTISVSLPLPYYNYEVFHPQFFYADINNDGQEEIIFTNDNRLYVYTYSYGMLYPCFTDGRASFNTKPLIFDYYKEKIVKNHLA